MINLIELYPDHLINMTTEEIFTAYGYQLEELELSIDALVNEFFIASATFSLPMWCSFAGIDYDSDLPIDIIRSNILAALKAKETTTVEVIKNIVESYSNGTCEVIEHYGRYQFTIKFVGIVGVPKKIGEIRKIIDKLKPAHLNYDFEFKYITWGDTNEFGKPAKWYKAKGLTWLDVRNGVHLT